MNGPRQRWRGLFAWLRGNRHLILGYLWIVLAIPTLIWWKDAIVWVALMSLYANAENSFAAHQAKKANKETR